MNDPGSRLIIALDYPDLDPALSIARRIGPHVGMLKVGLELFTSVGPPAISELRKLGARVFYDAKLYDIPNTVAGAAAAAARLGVSMLNVHALGGRAVMQAAREGARRGADQAALPPPLLIAVTLLTSLGEQEVKQELAISGGIQHAVARLASLARDAGLDGVVCSVQEVPNIKRLCGKDFLTVTPGIRPAWAAPDDQARVDTPRRALAAGADYLVVGRPITGADDPEQALSRLVAEITP
jgi:orotidine-5'-phosphate decarboxylase